MFLNNEQFTEEIKRKMKRISETNDNEDTTTQNLPMRCSKSSSKREVYSNTTLPLEMRKTSHRQPNFTSKTTGKRRTKNSKASKRK